MPEEKILFRKIAGSYQYVPKNPGSIGEILDLDPALWAALSAPVSALNGDKKFLTALDADGNGLIRVDEIRSAVKFAIEYFKDLEILGDNTPTLSASDVNDAGENGKSLQKFIKEHRDWLCSDGRVDLDMVRTKLAEVAASPLNGDGILTAAAAAGSAGEALLADVLAVSGGTLNAGGVAGVSAGQLDKFIADAKAFLAWAEEAQKPLFRDSDPVPFYDAFLPLKAKLDEYFSFCELIHLDPANEARFKLDPANLPQLDIHEPTEVAEALREAPLAKPDAAGVLKLDAQCNPFYLSLIQNFAGVFKLKSLSQAEWTAIKSDLAPYGDYLAKAIGDNVGKLGKEKLAGYVGGDAEEALRQLYAKDGRQGGVLNALRSLEKMILFKQHLYNFVNNFVSFRALFVPQERSLLQAGKLIMDGRTFELTLWISGVAAHKAIAAQSHLCMLYLALKANPNSPDVYVAVAVTAGDLDRVYVNKPVFFVDTMDRPYSGTIVDIVEGPISFRQTLWAPFRRLGKLIGEKVGKLTDVSGVEKKLASDIGKTGSGAPAPAPAPRSGNGSMLLLAGGLGIAALGAALSFVAKTFVSIADTLASMSFWKLISVILIIFLIFFIPASINALLKLHKRSLTLFLEAAGWAVNLPMRLSSAVSKVFTHYGVYPETARLNRRDLCTEKSYLARVFYGIIDTLLIIIGAAILSWMVYCYLIATGRI